MSRGALLVVCVAALLPGSPPAAAQEKEGPPPPGPDAPAAAGEERSPGAPPEREGSEKARKERRPEPGPGERREGPAPPAPDPDALRIESRIREIQLALLDEIVHVEERIAVIRWKLESELGLPGPRLEPGAPAPGVLAPGSKGLASGPEGAPGIPRKQAKKARAVRVGSAPEDLEEERRYSVLLEREREIVAKWKRAGARGPKASGKDGAAEAEKADLRAELERVLREVLDLRERARERQVERLRRELEDIQRALKVREDETERERLVISRMRELLGN